MASDVLEVSCFPHDLFKTVKNFVGHSVDWQQHPASEGVRRMLVAPQLSTETSRGAGRMRSVRQDHEYVRVCIADNPLLSAANFEWRMLDRHLPWRYSKFGVASFPGGLASAEIGDGSLFRVRTGGYLDPVVSLANQGVATDEVWVLTPIADLLYAKIIVAQRFPLTAERFESCDTRGD